MFPGRHSGWSDAARKKSAESRKSKHRNLEGAINDPVEKFHRAEEARAIRDVASRKNLPTSKSGFNKWVKTNPRMGPREQNVGWRNVLRSMK